MDVWNRELPFGFINTDIDKQLFIFFSLDLDTLDISYNFYRPVLKKVNMRLKERNPIAL